ncbi:MAG: hypothetical protein ACKOLA_10395 [Spartobacteria bacterium]
MFATQPSLPQWSELGEQLSGPNGESKREEILARLDALEARANSTLRSPDCTEPMRVEALIRALGHAREIATKVFKPVDLSAL